MPIQLLPTNHGTLVHGANWVVYDEIRLATLIAKVALGQAGHVSKILDGIGEVQTTAQNDVITSAIQMLTIQNDEDPWHRDGWMFQVMSWIAGRIANPKAISNPPQMILAQKGFDGIQLEFDQLTGISAVIIFEDKATDNARSTICNKVWPEFKTIENGSNTNVLVAEVTGLLERQPSVDAYDVISKVIWKEVRNYKVSITIGNEHHSDEGYSALFKGYDIAVSGDIKRRRGDTLYVAALRPWMEHIAKLTLNHLTELKNNNV